LEWHRLLNSFHAFDSAPDGGLTGLDPQPLMTRVGP